MALALMRTAYSPNMKSSLDLATGLCDPDGELIAQSLTLPVHLGAIPNAVAAVRRAYPAPPRPGDVFVLNDPYDGGTHLPDFFVLAPVFWPAPEGDGPLAGYVVTVAHYTDVGGRVAGGNASDSTEIYQEGLRLPPLKLVDAGTPQEGLFRLIARNVRVPRMVLGDLRAQLAACHTGVRETGALLRRRYGDGGGRPRFRAETAALVDYAERFARAETARPAGRHLRLRGRPRRRRDRPRPGRPAGGPDAERRPPGGRLHRQRRPRCGGRSTARSRSPARWSTPACAACSAATCRTTAATSGPSR